MMKKPTTFPMSLDQWNRASAKGRTEELRWQLKIVAEKQAEILDRPHCHFQRIKRLHKHCFGKAPGPGSATAESASESSAEAEAMAS